MVLVGKKGYGKTTKLRELVHLCRRVLIVDPECTWPDAGETIWDAGALIELARRRQLHDPRRPFRLIYRDRSLEQMQRAGPGLAFALRHCTLVIDELARVCHPNYLPPKLEALLQVGRHRAVNVLGTTREPQEIHDRFYSQADLLYCFRVEPGNGLDRLKRRYGAAFTRELPGLETHEFRNYGNPACLALLGQEGA